MGHQTNALVPLKFWRIERALAESILLPRFIFNEVASDAAMRVYRLEPNKDTSDCDWDATILKGECWVLADSEQQARKRVAFATNAGTRVEQCRPLRMNPWWNKEHSPGRDVPPGVVLAADCILTIPGGRPRKKSV